MHNPLVPIILLSGSLLAQVQFDDLAQSHHLPDRRENTHAQALADVDGDGDLDLVVANASRTRLFINQGDASFVKDTTGRLPTNYDARALAVGDLDNDGDPDLVVRTNLEVRVLLNDGSGAFAAGEIIPARATSTRSVLSLSDLDRDGDLDILTGGLKSASIFRNNLPGAFVDVTPAEFLALDRQTTAISCGDVNGDGQMDIVRGLAATLPPAAPQNQVFLGSGAFVYTEVKGGLPASAWWTRDLELVDIDGDGDLDLLQAGVTPCKVYENTGAGTFTDVSSTAWPGSPYALELEMVDFDRDGDLDVVVATTTGLRLFESSGTGQLVPSSIRFAGGTNETMFTLATGDLDGNGAVDIVAGGREHDSVWLNDANGNLHAANDFANGLIWYSPDPESMGDLDGDGDLDILRTDTALRRVMLNRGDGRFRSSPQTFPSLPPGTVALGDLDRDGDLDAILGNSQQLYLLDNQGDATFVEQSGVRIGVPLRGTPLLVDLNCDGWLDIVCWPDPWEIKVALNVRGRFPKVNSPTFASTASPIQVIDFDADGDLDLVNGLQTMMNDGLGNLTLTMPSRLPLIDHVWGICAGDVDHNGFSDLFMAVGPSTRSSRQDRLLLNFGGYFRDATLTHLPQRPNDFSRGAAIEDIDQDGDLDLVVSYASDFEILLNDGQGHFSPSSLGRIASSSKGRLICRDLDSDGDADIMNGNHVFENRLLHIGTTRLARLGMSFVIELEDHLAGGAVAVPFVGRRLQRPLDLGPIGRLGVDPSDLVFLPIVTLLGGRGSYEFVVPMNPTLVGMELGIQAIVARGQGTGNRPQGYRLTKTLSDVVSGR